jgi:DNA-binding transcriptional regulator YbjK
MAGANANGRRRQQRGEERRAAIVAATLALVEAEGVEGVTHRRIADAAGVPLAATTYYFSSKDHLLQAAMELHVERETATLRSLGEAVASQRLSVEEGVDAVIAWIAGMLAEHRRAQHAQFELYLRVARTATEPPGPPPWTAAYVTIAAQALERLGSEDPGRDAEALAALIHGLLLHGLTTFDPDFESRVLDPVLRGYLEHVLAPAALDGLSRPRRPGAHPRRRARRG